MEKAIAYIEEIQLLNQAKNKLVEQLTASETRNALLQAEISNIKTLTEQLTAETARNTELQIENSSLKLELEKLKRMIFGSKSERFVPKDDAQMQLPMEIPTAEIPEKPSETITLTRSKPVKNEPKQIPVRSALPAHLPRKTEIVEPAEIPANAKKIGENITEILEYTPGQIYVRKIIRPKYIVPVEAAQATPDHDIDIITAELPTLPLPKSNAGAGLLAQILISKYVDHLPFYRQAQMFKRQGVEIAESTINGWFSETCKLLEPLYYTLKQAVQKSNYTQADESPIAVLTNDKPGATHKGYLWVYLAPLLRLVFFDYQKGRGREGPLQFLENFSGALQTDGYAAYNIFDNRANIQLLACMAHVRRKFDEARSNDAPRAEYALLLIQKLYAVERQAKEQNLDFEARKTLRQQEAIPVLQQLEQWLKCQIIEVLPKSPIGQAVAYTLTLWQRLTRYTTDGRFLIDNNPVENTIRPVAIGRKNYLFAGSHQGAERAAMMYSFLGTCKLNNIEPFEWLKHTLEIIPDYKANKLADLLPINHK